MTNSLIVARDGFLARHPETRRRLGGRDWGLIDTGGSGPAFVFLPGTLGRADVFFRQIEALAPLRRVLAVSYPEEGSIAEWCADLVALLDAEGIAQTAVLGTSLGGLVAQYFAATAPGRVSHLFAANTLASTEMVAQVPPYSSDLRAAPIAELRAGFLRNMAAWGAAEPEQREVVEMLTAEAAGRIPEAELRIRLLATKEAPALPDPGPNPDDRVSVIEGADDPLLPPVIREGVAERLAPAPVFRFLSGGHFPYLLHPELYSGLLLARLGHADLAPQWNKTESGVIAA